MVKRLYNLREQFFDSNGDPLSGGQLFVYLAASSTRSTTYNSSTGLSANTNPLVLDSSGRLQAEVWVATALSYKLVLGLTGDGTAFVDPSSPIWTEDNVTAINDTTGLDQQWILGPTPTYIGATQFSLVGDQTTNFEVGRRVKATVTAGTVYGTIKTSVFGAVTTVTLTEQSGSLDSGLSAVYYSVLSVAGDNKPRSDAIPVSSGSSDPSKMVRIEADGITTGTTRVATMPDRDITFNALSPITASLGADVALNNTGLYFDGPSIAQGTSGTWFVSGTVTLQDTAGAAQFRVKLWDGTTVIAATVGRTDVINAVVTVSLSGYIASPAGNLRISVSDVTSTSGVIRFNATTLSKDSTISAVRVG